MPLAGLDTVTTEFVAMASRRADGVALRWRAKDRSWDTATWADYASAVARLAGGLHALGVGAGERVVLLLRNRPELHYLDVASLLAGAVPVSIYNSTPLEGLRQLLAHSGAVLVVADDTELMERALSAREGAAGVRHVAVVADHEGGAPPEVIHYEQLAAGPPTDIEAAAARVRPEDLATVIYTSGTTGPPKGVMITHANVAATAEGLRRAVQRTRTDLAGKRVVSYLPMAHIAERMISHYEAIGCGLDVTTCPDPGLLARYLPEVRPHIAFGVPRVWERIHARVTELLPDADAAAARAASGLDEIELAFTGAAPASPGLIAWFRSIGVPLTDIYGLSETTGAVATETAAARPGWIGRPIPGVEVRLAANGEVLVRGANVFAGYLHDADATAQAVDSEGWLHTGDIGELSEDGYLRVVDRQKELIVTSGGKKISPANIETALRGLPIVAQAVVVGDGRPFLAALLVLDGDVSRNLGREAVSDVLEKGIAAVNATLSPPERVERWTVLGGGEWAPDSDELTPTMKLKRRAVEAKYAAQIEALYRRS